MFYPKITLITPTFNSEKYIRSTLESIISQKYPNLEFIVVDGMSKDSTLEIINSYDIVDKLIIGEDKNLYDAINKGIQNSTGELIKIINSDDYLLENCLGDAAKNIDNSNNKKIVIDGYLKAINEDGTFKSIWTNKHKIINNYDTFNHPSWFVPRKVYDEFGLYSTDYSISSDYEYYLRLKKNNVHFQTIKRPIVAFRMGGISYNLDSMPELIEINLKHFSAIKAYPDYYKQYFLKFCKSFTIKLDKCFRLLFQYSIFLKKNNLAKLL